MMMMNSLAMNSGDDSPGSSPRGLVNLDDDDLEAVKVLGADDAADSLLRFGMMHMTGDGVPVDLVAAHKWFNLAAMRGNKEACRLRREIAAEMSQSEIAAAQRAARDWALRTSRVSD
jgi:TPR repeat protein